MYWTRFQGFYPMPEGVPPFPQAAQAAASAASATAPLAGAAAPSATTNAAHAAFAHPPHYGPSALPHPHAPSPYYAEFGRHSSRYYRRGPRLFPILLVAGAGIWAHCHLAREVYQVREEGQQLRREVRAMANAQLEGTNGVKAMEDVREEIKEDRRRRGWGGGAWRREREQAWQQQQEGKVV